MRRWVTLAALGVGGGSGLAVADVPRDTPAAIDVDRGRPPPARIELGFDGGAPVDGWAVGLQLGLLARPIALRSIDQTFLPVAHRQTIAVGGALAVGPTLIVDARWSMARQTRDRLAAFGMARALDRIVPGDLQLGARVRLVRVDRGEVFVRGEIVLPTGDDRDFAGEASWAAAWSLIGRARWPAGIVTAVTAGIRLRGAEVMVADRLVGDELFGGVGLVVPVPAIRPLWCDPAQVKLTGEVVGILGNDVGRGRGPSPAEARIGLVTTPTSTLTLGVRLGAGIVDEIGAPRWRASFELAYQPRGAAAALAAGVARP